MHTIGIPTDIYESPREIVIIIPLGWVDKKTIELYFEDFILMLKGVRHRPLLKEDLMMQQEECYRWEFEQKIPLPPHVYFDRIHSEVTPDNILIITVPKALQPGKMKIGVTIAQPTTSAPKARKKPL
jgi:HSP20 family molecular chaperone IbpA